MVKNVRTSLTRKERHTLRGPQGPEGEAVPCSKTQPLWIQMPEIVHLSKQAIHPRFGYAVPSEQKAFVREDLPRCVREFVTVHELYHLKDRAKWWVWKEVKANMAGALRHPVGFALCVVLSLAPARLHYYCKRAAGKEE